MGIGSPGRRLGTCLAIAAALLGWAVPAHADTPGAVTTVAVPAPVPAPALAPPAVDAVTGSAPVAPAAQSPVATPAPPAPATLPAAAPALPEVPTAAVSRVAARVAATVAPPTSSRPAPRPAALAAARPPHRRAPQRAAARAAASHLSTGLSHAGSRSPIPVRPDEVRTAVPHRVTASSAAGRVPGALPSPALPGRASTDCGAPVACSGAGGSGGGSAPPTALILECFVFCALLFGSAPVVTARSPHGFRPVLLLERPG
jgi:hypothetical protein